MFLRYSILSNLYVVWNNEVDFSISWLKFFQSRSVWWYIILLEKVITKVFLRCQPDNIIQSPDATGVGILFAALLLQVPSLYSTQLSLSLFLKSWKFPLACDSCLRLIFYRIRIWVYLNIIGNNQQYIEEYFRC